MTRTTFGMFIIVNYIRVSLFPFYQIITLKIQSCLFWYRIKIEITHADRSKIRVRPQRYIIKVDTIYMYKEMTIHIAKLAKKKDFTPKNNYCNKRDTL